MVKRVVAWLLACLLMNGCVYAENPAVQQVEAVETAVAHFCETTGFPSDEVGELSIACEYQDSPLSDPAIPDRRWVVGISYERCNGLLCAALSYTLTQDGKSIVGEPLVEEFKTRYEAIQRVEPVLAAQRSAEKEKGPFRDWSAQERQAFTAQYGDISGELRLLDCPQQTELQYWEIGKIVRRTLREEGYEAEDFASRELKCSYSSSDMDWIPTVWEFEFFSRGEEAAETVHKELAVEVQLDGFEVTSCEIYRYDADGFLDNLPSGPEAEAFAKSFE